MTDRFIDEASLVENSGKTILDESATKVVIRGSGASANLQSGLEVRARAVQFAALQEKITEIVMRRVVVTRDSQRMVPEHLAIFPIRRLYKRQPAQGNDDRSRDSCAE